MPDFGLPQRTINTLHTIFAKHSKVNKVVIYGSRAMGNYKKGSDIDLTMFGDDLEFRDISRIAGELDDSDIPYQADLSIFDHLDHAKLKDHINRVGKVFYDRYAGWKTVKLSEVCEFVRGLTYSKKDEVENSNNRVLRATNIDLETHALKLDEIRFINDNVAVRQDKKVKQNDILICTASGSKSHLGKVALINSSMDFAFGGFMAVIRVTEEILPQYLFKNLISQNFKNHIARLSDGANINNLKFDLIKDFQIPLPPLPEQKQIVEKLDVAFAQINKAITAAKRKQAQINALKRSILTNELTADADSAWKTVKLENLYKVGSSKRVFKSQWQTKGIPFYRGREITSLSQNSSVNNELFITKEHYKDLASKHGVPKANDIMITAIGTIGNSYIVKADDEFYFKDGSVLWLKKETEDSSQYVEYWLRSNLFKNQLDKGNGATVDTLIISKMSSMEIEIPLLPVQKQIVKKLDAAFAQIQAASSATAKQITEYQSLKSAILSQKLQNKTA